MTPDRALAMIQEHGVVLVSAKGPAPRLVDLITEESIKGNWWIHPRAREIYAVLQNLEDSPDILVCRLVMGKITMVHRRLWPALARIAAHLPTEQVAQLRQEHSAKGNHVTRSVPFPDWVDPETSRMAQLLSEQEAYTALGGGVRSDR